MSQYHDLFIYMTIIVASYTFVGVWVGDVNQKHKLFPWGSGKHVERRDSNSDFFFGGVSFFIVGFCMASFEWIMK